PLHTAMRHIHAPPRPPSELRSGILKDLERVVLKALAKWPQERQQSAELLRSELLAVLPRLPGPIDAPADVPSGVATARRAPDTAKPVPKDTPTDVDEVGESTDTDAPAEPRELLIRQPTEQQVGMRLGGGLGKLVAP